MSAEGVGELCLISLFLIPCIAGDFFNMTMTHTFSQGENPVTGLYGAHVGDFVVEQHSPSNIRALKIILQEFVMNLHT